jgi:uncharacterized protein (TIGR02145 family)
MKNFRFLNFGMLLMLGLTTAVFNSCGSKKGLHRDKGVVINGVKWATRNVDAAGTFAAKPEDSGMFYQWNRKTAWAATGNVTGWDDTVPEGATWEKANDPSPAGWRVPTVDEIQTLFDKDKVNKEWTTVNGVKGHRFTDKATGNSIFLPAAGGCFNSGALYGTGSYGSYWSSTRYGSDVAYGLSFGRGVVDLGSNGMAYGYSCRCVAE